MASILPFGRKKKQSAVPTSAAVAAFLDGFSIEVMPRTAAKIEDFQAILPPGTRVYVAHIDGTPIEDMVLTARRLVEEGFPAMPHFPARMIADRATLQNWIERYRDVGVEQALLIAGGLSQPQGTYSDAMQLLQTGLFDEHGFTHLHVAGHPEGNRDIDPAGGTRNLLRALHWKNDFQTRTDAKMAIATQFCFEAEPIIEWADTLRTEGITLPIHIGIAGPAKLQTMIKFAMACGVGPSMRVLQRRAADITRLMLPFAPDEVLRDLAAHKAAHPDFNIKAVHFFPLGGIGKTAEFAGDNLAAANSGAARA